MGGGHITASHRVSRGKKGGIPHKWQGRMEVCGDPQQVHGRKRGSATLDIFFGSNTKTIHSDRLMRRCKKRKSGEAVERKKFQGSGGLGPQAR